MVICILEFIFDISTQQWEAACEAHPVVSPALSCRVHIMDFNLSGEKWKKWSDDAKPRLQNLYKNVTKPMLHLCDRAQGLQCKLYTCELPRCLTWSSGPNFQSNAGTHNGVELKSSKPWNSQNASKSWEKFSKSPSTILIYRQFSVEFGCSASSLLECGLLTMGLMV